MSRAEVTPYGWDWTQTTHPSNGGAPREQAAEMLAALNPAMVIPGKGLQGWERSIVGFDAEGFQTATIYFGGRDDVHVKATSSVADGTRELFRDFEHALTARVDTRVDTLAPWDELTEVMRTAADKYRSKVIYMQDQTGRENNGRTLYLGAPSSAIRVRLYEKWLESPGQYAEGTNRLEVQLRPPSKVKAQVTGWSRAQTFCASRTTRALAEQLDGVLAPAASLHVSRGTPDIERTLEVMGEQYGKAVRRWLELSGGDVGRVIDYLTDTAQPEEGDAA